MEGTKTNLIRLCCLQGYYTVSICKSIVQLRNLRLNCVTSTFEIKAYAPASALLVKGCVIEAYSGSAHNLTVSYYPNTKATCLFSEYIIRASQTQLHSISRPGHTEFNLIFCELMDIMWQELSGNTRTADNWPITQKQEVC